MTLTRQLWTAIAVLITLTFVSGFIVSVYSARNYYVEQLTVKNIDNATGLALSLSQMEKDPVTVELMISAQFDTGHYQRIELVDPQDQILQRKQRAETNSQVPAWFEALMAFDIPPGVAQVQDGWRQYGTLYIESQSQYALAALWRVSYQLLAWFLAIALVCGLIGSMVLRRISQPLEAVVEQAEAIGERRFITSEEPRTLEFMRLVRAMNTLTNRVRAMLEADARRIDEIRRQSQQDPATGVANREQFFRMLQARLSLDDVAVQDAVILVRVVGLSALNAKLGRAGADEWILALLARFRATLEAGANSYTDYTVGRLNGSDFAILLHNTDFLAGLAESLWKAASALVEEQDLEGEYPLALVGSYFHPGEDRGLLMARLDDLLARAEQPPDRRLLLADQQQARPLFADAASWKRALLQAIDANAVFHACYPVVSDTGVVYHEEAMLRMHLGESVVSAGAVIGWARRLDLLPRLDLQVLDSVLAKLSEDDDLVIAVNLSMESLLDAPTYLAIIQRLEDRTDSVCQRLALEFNEQVAVQHAPLLASFLSAAKAQGVTVGLQSAGKNIPAVPGLERFGLDYMKVDASLIQDLDDDVCRLLRGLCQLGHSLGLTMIAEGVGPETDRRALSELGFDAFTGPGIAPG